MEKVLDAVDFENAPLGDVLKSLSGRAGLNLVVDWPALTAGGVDAKTPISIHLKNTKLWVAVDAVMMLANTGVQDDDHKIAWDVQNGLMTVSNRRNTGDRQTIVRVYDVTGLMRQPERWRMKLGLPVLDENQSSGSRNQQQARPDIDTELDAIKSFVEESVDSGSWKDNGGDIGSIATFAGQLIVTTTEPNHRKN